ncbi:MAG TPA: lipopolysaccharide kinase InaA family protein, partial [Vicinamibacterales bacterium]|nr:lipopolysaccharide kinase InaA family protein [Vicinamibacterales bacterium]
MSERGYARWAFDGWRGLVRADVPVAPDRAVAAAAAGGTRRSRHAHTERVDLAGVVVYVKGYPPPGARRAWRAFRMGRALARAGFRVPETMVVGRRGGQGVLVTADVGAPSLLAAIAATRAEPCPLRAKRRLLARLGTEVGRLHAAGFVHGDLVPSNLLAAGDTLAFLDNDRTRRGRVLVWWGARRNLVQLGRFVIAGITLTDRLRVLRAYAATRGLRPRARRRLARWL